MRLLSILSAILVVCVLYLVLLQRPALLTFAYGEGIDQALAVARGEAEPSQAVQIALGTVEESPGDADTSDEAEATPAAAPDAETRAVRVVARHSTAQMVESAVRLRGQTEAARRVTLLSETASTVMSAPLPRGSLIEGASSCANWTPARERPPWPRPAPAWRRPRPRNPPPPPPWPRPRRGWRRHRST